MASNMGEEANVLKEQLIVSITSTLFYLCGYRYIMEKGLMKSRILFNLK